MPSFHTRIPLVLMAVAGALATTWVLTPPKSRRYGTPVPHDGNTPTHPTPVSPDPPVSAARSDRAPVGNPEATDQNPPAPALTSRDETAPSRPGTRATPPHPQPGNQDPLPPHLTAEAATSVPGRPILRAPTSAGPTRRGPASSVDHISAEQNDNAAAEPPLIVPYSPLDPSLPATLPAALAAPAPTAGPDEALATETARLAEGFFQQIGDATEDPRDAAYQQRWLEAQEETDARMRASLGGHTWLDHHREAHRQTQQTDVDGAAQNADGR